MALDPETRKPVPTPRVKPETTRQIELYDGALQRRELRLVMAGRLNPEDAKDLQKIFGL